MHAELPFIFPLKTIEGTASLGDCQGALLLTVTRTGGMYAGRTENFRRERRRPDEIFLLCGFSARKPRRDFRKNRRGIPKGGRIPSFALLRSRKSEQQQNFCRKRLTIQRPSAIIFFAVYGMRSWRNRHTRTFEGRVLKGVRVQVSSAAPDE